MKLLPRKLLLSSAGCALVSAASLSLPACTETGTVTGSSSHSGAYLYQRANGRYYHCHPNGVCHNARDTNYTIRGNYRSPRSHYRPPSARPYPLPAAPPPRPRPR